MKKLFGALGFLLLISCQNHSGGGVSKFKTIMIKSEGEVETLPDEASFYIELSCIDKSIKVSKNCLVDKSNNLINTLLKFEIRKDDILTTAVNMSKSYTWKFNSNVFEGYRSSTTVYVTVKDIEKLDDIYTELMENQNLDLGGLSYSHSKLDSLKNEAYVKALEKAGILADKLLEKLPESKKEILKIGNVEIKASYPKDEESNFELKERAANINMNANNSIAISKGTVLVTATLFVEYQIR